MFHRDIKPANIFVLSDSTNEYNMKNIMIDYAFTCSADFHKRYKGTKEYLPEEMKLADKKSDWYNGTIDVFELASTFLKKLGLMLYNE